MSLLGLIVLIVDIVAIIKLLEASIKIEKKILWTAIIVLLPVLGPIVWWFFGPKKK